MLQHSDCDLYEVRKPRVRCILFLVLYLIQYIFLQADIFALGVSVYELSTADPLPAEGEEYHALRDGAIPHIENFSGPFQACQPCQVSSDSAHALV